MWCSKEPLFSPLKSHWSHLKKVEALTGSVCETIYGGVSLEAMDANDGILNDVTGAVIVAVTGAVTVDVTGGVTEAVTGAVTGGGAAAGSKTGSRGATGTGTEARAGEGTGAVALEAWWRAARCRPRSFSTGPR